MLIQNIIDRAMSLSLYDPFTRIAPEEEKHLLTKLAIDILNSITQKLNVVLNDPEYVNIPLEDGYQATYMRIVRNGNFDLLEVVINMREIFSISVDDIILEARPFTDICGKKEEGYYFDRTQGTILVYQKSYGKKIKIYGKKAFPLVLTQETIYYNDKINQESVQIPNLQSLPDGYEYYYVFTFFPTEFYLGTYALLGEYMIYKLAQGLAREKNTPFAQEKMVYLQELEMDLKNSTKLNLQPHTI